jgi:hypothetical protein
MAMAINNGNDTTILFISYHSLGALSSSRDRDSNTIFISSSPDEPTRNILSSFLIDNNSPNLKTATATTQGLAVAGQGPAANQERATAESPNHQLIPANNNRQS